MIHVSGCIYSFALEAHSHRYVGTGRQVTCFSDYIYMMFIMRNGRSQVNAIGRKVCRVLADVTKANSGPFCLEAIS